MAVVSMLRMRLLAHDSEKNKIMRVLTRSGACEITEAELPEGLSRPKISTETFEEKTAKLEFGIYFLKEMQKQYTPEKGVEFKKLNFKKGKQAVRNRKLRGGCTKRKRHFFGY